MYYVQDARSYVGNDVLWWAKDGKGYTTDLSKAEVWTKDEAVKQHASRPTDVPWPKEYIDGKTRPAVDVQHIDKDVALAGTGIKLTSLKPARREQPKCHSCGVFLTVEDYYSSFGCPRCGADNRP